MERIVKVAGEKIGLKVSAGTVRAYRDTFGRDLILDMGAVEADILGSKTRTLSASSAEIAENAIYIMAKEFDKSIGSIEEWLEQYSPYFIYGAVVHAIGMWHDNLKTLNESKKN